MVKDNIKIHYQKQIDDNTIKYNVTATSSSFNQNNGALRILIHFLAKNHAYLPNTAG